MLPAPSSLNSSHKRLGIALQWGRPKYFPNGRATIGDIIKRLRTMPEHSRDDGVDHDVILLWNETRRIITGGDILERLLRGIVQNPAVDRGIASNSKGAGTE